MVFTLVSFHAHPDDEALLTGGTLARAAAEGHRVVLVTATAGEAGLAGTAEDLGARRRAELAASAAALGVARWELLDYPDSGWNEPVGVRDGRPDFVHTSVEDAATRLAGLLREEGADVLTIYDAHGGYGHPDHRQVHLVGVRAAALAGTPVVLEATVDGDRLRRIARLLQRIPGLRHLVPDDGFADAFVPRSELTHEVDVRPHLRAKLAALAAHRSQAAGGSGIRTVALLIRLPRPLLAPVLGREWFRERDHDVIGSGPLSDDVFASLRRTQ